MAKKTTTGDWRRHYHNEYKTGRLSYETKMVQWAHIMMLDEMFECQKRGECLLYKHAVKRYGKKNVDRLLEQNIFRKEKSNFNDDICIYSLQIDTNIIDINHITKVKKEAANIRHYGNPEGKQEHNPIKELEIKKAEQELKQIEKQEKENAKWQKLVDEAKKNSTHHNEKNNDDNKPYMGTNFIT